jgi:hypothetical protein
MKREITPKNKLTYDEIRVMRVVEEYYRRLANDRERTRPNGNV